jgi:nitrogenase molybdenum-iron protein alpha/beta subunit
MADCGSPVWPCAMTGAVACLSGFDGLGVVVHGSSGCYYFPAATLHSPLHGTFILQEEVIFGSETRLREVLESIRLQYSRVAVVSTCVPAVTGEDIRGMLEEFGVIHVDSPGFCGEYEEGYRMAIQSIIRESAFTGSGVNIDGLSRADPFSAGNLREIERILGSMGVGIGVRFAMDDYLRLIQPSRYTVGTNEDIRSGCGEFAGSFLGLDRTMRTLKRLEDLTGCPADTSLKEAEAAEERIISAADTFLRRHDPPIVAVFGGASYALFAADLLSRSLDATIEIICTRNEPLRSRFPSRMSRDLDEITELIHEHQPDLILGSTFEAIVSGGVAAFVSISPPLRGRVRLVSRPLAGVEGSLSLIEETLNACLDHEKT